MSGLQGSAPGVRAFTEGAVALEKGANRTSSLVVFGGVAPAAAAAAQWYGRR